ncbi:hypothetical protein NBH00_21660 [Paraconexibacter antarcticus]|uniref:Uncharacterized protein n=1 Tax=Paraconexibacter antarcticus TaxID=2949664 RepID=A0ABY5DS77_9ACTN|nr:hypothetical protein [Paraconexibacter antarcticus]UTI63937.1 hypothetical protein NBH00_21660 [Paraconexibacter antarcticus]
MKLGEYFFRPKTLTIRAGTSVRFTNVGKIEHTVADSTKSGTILSNLIHPRPLKHGQSQTVRFATRGTIQPRPSAAMADSTVREWAS